MMELEIHRIEEEVARQPKKTLSKRKTMLDRSTWRKKPNWKRSSKRMRARMPKMGKSNRSKRILKTIKINSPERKLRIG
jgi:hypothetical protein